MMSESELLELCKDIPLRNVPFESAECYGIGRHLREYGYYPQWLPLCVSTDHGPSQRDTPTLLEFNDGSPVMLYHSRRLVLEWREKSTKPCHTMMSPFVFYRMQNNIRKADDARGTLAFPVHSTDLIESEYDIEKYIKSLLSLPSEFQPISVCLHYLDVRKGRHAIFKKYGIPVFTAGHVYDKRFTERFYEILRKFAYATSNHLGSYAFYAVEMGTPFFIHGGQSVMINRGDPNCPDGRYDPSKISQQYKTVRSIFENISTEITQDQKNIVESELGIHDGISRLKMAIILYSSPAKWFFSKRFIGHILYGLYKTLPFFLKHYIYFLRHGLAQEAKIGTHLTAEEKIALHQLAKERSSGSVAVEVGSYLGASSCFLADGLLRNDGVLYCIDTWQNETMPDGERDTYDEFNKNISKYRNVIRPLRGRSNKVIDDFRKLNLSIDLFFIDGDHSYEACKADWELYFPFLKKGSIVVFHDTGWAEGVNQVIASSVTKVADMILKLPNLQAYKINTEYKCVN